jgi:thioredoxin 1
MEKLNSKAFQEKVFDTTLSTGSVQFKGLLPAIVIFDAVNPWSTRLHTDVDEVAELYAGKLNFYLVDVTEELELADKFGVAVLPMIMLISLSRPPVVAVGQTSKEGVLEIAETLLGSHKILQPKRAPLIVPGR